MTPDVEQIRAALAAAPTNTATQRQMMLICTSLCDEIERLRGERDDHKERLGTEAFTAPDADYDTMVDSLQCRIGDLLAGQKTFDEWTAQQCAGLVAERDAALANVKRIGDIAEKALAQLDEAGARNVAALADLNKHKSALHDMSVDFAVLEQQLAAALAECERLRNDLRLVKGAAARVRDRLTVERDRYHDCVDLDRLQADY